MKHATAFVFGALFSVGLAVSGMIRPGKVEGFLNPTGNWDPTLAFVMGGALLVFFPGYRWVARRQRPVAESNFDIPTRTEITPQLVAGSIIFGVGWGISGFCPAAAFTALPALSSNAVLVIIGMVAGIVGMRSLRTIMVPHSAPTTADF